MQFEHSCRNLNALVDRHTTVWLKKKLNKNVELKEKYNKISIA